MMTEETAEMLAPECPPDESLQPILGTCRRECRTGHAHARWLCDRLRHAAKAIRVMGNVMKRICIFGSATSVVLATFSCAVAAELPAFPVKAPPVASLYDWTGFYVGGHMGYAGGNSNWTANPTQAGLPSTSGSVDMTLPIDNFSEAGSFFMGFQGGYNYMLANRMVFG